MFEVKSHTLPNLFILSVPTTFSEIGLATINLSPNLPLEEHFEFDQIHPVNGIEYREWNPFKCFLASCVHGGLGMINNIIEPGCRMLCIGCSPLTIAACSDIISSSGRIFSVNSTKSFGEFDWKKMQAQRSNLMSICGDATKPQEYESMIEERVDVIIVNGSIEILEKNAELFLKEGGTFLITGRKPDGVTDSNWCNNLISLVSRSLDPHEMLVLFPYFPDLVVLGGSTKKTKPTY